ncbi:MAG TPA: hypothetical protein PLN56_11700 [Methanoregulaceae archaeon]|nr:hypothetical protein [Methanoregulaceae archaeon]
MSCSGRILVNGTVQDLSLLLVFGAGALTPFLGVGILGGYAFIEQDKEGTGI